MRSYDKATPGHGTAPFWKSLRAIVLRWCDRERELASLRNAVGMMSEARRGDAAEYAEMAGALQRARQQIHVLQSHLDARTQRAHVASADCWCGPTVEHIDPDTGAAVLVHRRLQ